MTARVRGARGDDSAPGRASLLHNMPSRPSFAVRHHSWGTGQRLGLLDFEPEDVASLRSDPERWLGGLVSRGARCLSRADIVRALDERLAASPVPGFAIVRIPKYVVGSPLVGCVWGESNDRLLAASVFARCSSRLFLARLPPRLECIADLAVTGVVLCYVDTASQPPPSAASSPEVDP